MQGMAQSSITKFYICPLAELSQYLQLGDFRLCVCNVPEQLLTGSGRHKNGVVVKVVNITSGYLNKYSCLQIMGIVERYFSNPCVKEHLQQAISAMERDHLQTPTSPQVVNIH